MERSSGNSTVKPYSSLARYYDELLVNEEDFDYWLKEIESRPFVSCLDLASGTAILPAELKKKGYLVIASDLSEEMKEASKENFDGEYLILDMTDYHLDRKFDLITCLVDSVNYLDYEGLRNFMKCSYEHLNKNGRLIFDAHTLERLDEFKEEYIEEGNFNDSVNYLWQIVSDKEAGTLMEHFAFYFPDEMKCEHHLQHIYSIEQIEKLMKDTGFEVKTDPDFIPHEKILVTGRKI